MKFLACLITALIFTVLFLIDSIVTINLKIRNESFLEPINQLFFIELKKVIDGRDNFSILDDGLEFEGYAGIKYIDENKFKMINEKQENKMNLISEVYFYKTMLEKGWDKLSMNTYKGSEKDKTFSPFIQAYFGGYLESRLTFRSTNNFLTNLEYNYKKQDPNLKIMNSIKKFFRKVYDNMYNNISKFNEIYTSKKDREYYYKIYIFYAQLKGLFDGHNKAVEIANKDSNLQVKIRKLQIEDLLLIQADGEIPELMRYFNYKINERVYKLGDNNYFRNVYNIESENPEKIWKKIMMKSRCSAMIKITHDEEGNMTELFAGHTTWTDYSETYRTYKHYYMELNDYHNNPITVETTFSSYPGFISSSDDYYVTNNKLMVTETTLEVIDINIYNDVKKEDKFIPNFMRINSATFFSSNAKEWIDNFSYFNSGTYSSQWMVLDYKVFQSAKENKTKPNNLLYVLEQTPNSITSHDVSDYLNKNSFYASFNRAFFKETNESLNTQLIKELYGDIFTFEGGLRGKIFRQFEKGVKNLKQFKNLMRYNGFKLKLESFSDDPSFNSPGHGISARYDLEEKGSNNLSGGIDCKITNSKLIDDISSVIISGPTTENNSNLTVFKWSDYASKDIRHVGLPEIYDFQWVLASPMTLKFNKEDIYNFEK